MNSCALSVKDLDPRLPLDLGLAKNNVALKLFVDIGNVISYNYVYMCKREEKKFTKEKIKIYIGFLIWRCRPGKRWTDIDARSRVVERFKRSRKGEVKTDKQILRQVYKCSNNKTTTIISN